MSRTSLEDFNCSLARTVDIIGDKWSLLIIRDAFYGIQTFSQFFERLGMAKTVLSDRLQILTDNALLTREQTRPGVERYKYKLTQKGRDLFPVVISLVQWGDKWIFGEEKKPVKILDREQHSPIQHVAVQARSGRFLEARDVSFAPGPGATPKTLELFEKMNK